MDSGSRNEPAVLDMKSSGDESVLAPAPGVSADSRRSSRQILHSVKRFQSVLALALMVLALA